MDTFTNGVRFFKQTVRLDDWLVGLVIILFMIVAIVTLIQKLIGLLKKPVQKAKQNQEDHETISITKADIDKLKKKQQADVEQSKKQRTQISNALAELKQIVLKDKCERIRSEIISFSTQVFNRKIRKDEYDHVFNLCHQYEQLLKLTKMTNGQTKKAQEIIQQGYKQHLKNGFDE